MKEKLIIIIAFTISIIVLNIIGPIRSANSDVDIRNWDRYERDRIIDLLKEIAENTR